jgi:hypothetical protein
MNELDKAYSIFLVKIVKIITIIYGIYLICIIIFNISLKETDGNVTRIHIYEDTYYSKKGNREEKNQRKDIYYQYNVDGISFTGKRLSNLLIFPNFDLEKDEQITIYYCTFIPNYSVLFRGNFKYIFYNTIPIIICWIIIHIIKTKNNLYGDFKKENKKHFVEIEKNQDKNENNHNDIIEMENIFIEETGNGEKAIKFLKISNESDGMIIESLFKSEQIPYKIEFHSKAHTYRNSLFCILEKDYADALFVLEEYMKTKTEIEKEKIVIYKKQHGT